MSLQMNAADAPMNMRVTAIRYAADDINVYEIRRPDNAALPRAEPGAHIDVHMPSGLMRQYSLVTADGDERAYLIGIKRDRASRGGSRFMHEQLRVGQMLDIGGPRNNFPLCETASHTVLIAGGIGITPIWCMAQRLMRLNRSFELHYACRERSEAAFLDTLTALPQARLHFDSEQEGRVLDMPGIVARAPEGSHFYCCGPQPMLKGYEDATASIDQERVHVEYFAPRAVAACDGGFVVQLHRTGQQFEVPAGKTILQVLRESGVAAPYSCEEGICGACQVDVVEGTPDHRDSVLTEREQASSRTMLICCSGSKSGRLVIDF
ncbi:oxidoreductase (plasmid) [Burkholderia sp. THE68]|uniref:PDR/VanB family oxidoreductase n=1 Tax=Burkholderia sp. THE68 TaxID=758782 RepID=UPI001316EE08|nr:PDR/VanB family oxidoreductase [Burkholderia sp. THE68]BBU33039.1 oxidoreductase [Burkholderia sp. THE68]